MIESVKDKDEGAKPCWFNIRARRLRGHEVQTRLAKSTAESFKDARLVKLLGVPRPRRPEPQLSREKLGSAECPNP